MDFRPAVPLTPNRRGDRLSQDKKRRVLGLALSLKHSSQTKGLHSRPCFVPLRKETAQKLLVANVLTH